MIYLRPLKQEDASLMLEWMHDKNIQKAFAKNMTSRTIDDVTEFIQESQAVQKKGVFDGCSLHFAVARDDTDEYLGTISLKNINLYNMDAEYAISMRKISQGTGASYEATIQLLKLAFETYNLHKVYLNCLTQNIRARKFYKKCGFHYIGQIHQDLTQENKSLDLSLYSMLSSDYTTLFKNI